MTHTYRHHFRNGLLASVFIDDDQLTFEENVILWTACPYGYNPQLSADYIRWWDYISNDFLERTGRFVLPAIGNPGTWPKPE